MKTSEILSTLFLSMATQHLDVTQVDCLVTAVVFESGIALTTKKDRLSVVRTVTERSIKKNKTPCEIVQDCKFSYYCDDKSEHIRLDNYYHMELYTNQAKEVITFIRGNGVFRKNPTTKTHWWMKGFSHYHANSIRIPYWAVGEEVLENTGWHKFYLIERY